MIFSRKDIILLPDNDGQFKEHFSKEVIKIVITPPKTEWHLKTNPPLYLIFANSEEGTDMSLMKQVNAFAEKTKWPCHVIGQKVLFYGASNDEKVGIHFNTDKHTIKELIANGFKNFIKLNMQSNPNDPYEINYFKQEAEDGMREKVLPVIISINNGGMTKEVKQIAKKLRIPIFRFKMDHQLFNVLWYDGSTMVEFSSSTNFPWDVKYTSSSCSYPMDISMSCDISLLSDVHRDIDTLICCFVIGVHIRCMQNKSRKGMYTEYSSTSAIYLLTKGKWNIPKRYIKETLQEVSRDGIYQKIIKVELIKELVKSLSNKGYKLPEDREKLDQEMEIIKCDSECFGLIFFALLQKRYWAGASNLVEMGYIGIHYMLVGTVLLQNELNNWNTTTPLKETLQHLEKNFIERAISITSYIYETDKRNQSKEEDLVVDNHAQRLLLNHGYLRAAIYTENTTYLESDTVKKILAKSFYGTEIVDGQTTLCFILLVAVHILLLPLVALNMEASPLRWLYQKYSLHFMKVYIHMLGFSVLLFAYAYMLLFDYRPDRITLTDYVIIVWMTSFFVDETKQVIVAVIRSQLTKYSTDWWNLLDWLLIIVYASGMILKIGEDTAFRTTAKILLVTAFMALCTRLLHLSFMTEFLGRKLVINRKMIKDSIAFLIIITIVLVWYSVSFYALMYPNSEFSWIQIEKILRHGYWMLFGELNLDEPGCTFNRTLYENGVLQRCPTELGLYVTPYLTAFYGLIAVVLLLNLLIAMYSDTYTKVQENANLYWLQTQTDLFEEYSIKTVFPIHLQLLTLPGTLLAIIGFGYVFLKKRLTKLSPDISEHPFPMLVRVFLYNSNYDLRLSKTIKAEENGLETVREKFKTNTKFFEESDHEKTMTKLKDMEKSYKAIPEKTLAKLRVMEQSYKDIPEQLTDRLKNIEQMLQEITNKLQKEPRDKGRPNAVGILDEENSTTIV